MGIWLEENLCTEVPPVFIRLNQTVRIVTIKPLQISGATKPTETHWQTIMGCLGGVTDCCLGGEGNGCSPPKLALRVADMTVATVVTCCTATATAATCCPKEANVCVMAAAHVVHCIRIYVYVCMYMYMESPRRELPQSIERGD